MPVPQRSSRLVRRRLLSLATGELAATAVLLWSVFGVLRAPRSPANLAGAGVAVFLLVQGSAWWVVKRRAMTDRSRSVVGLATFRVLRWGDPVVLAVAGTIVIVQLAVGPVVRAAAGAGFWVLAVLEYVNYFHWQLMYDNRADLRWLLRHGPKRAPLARALDRGGTGDHPAPRRLRAGR